MIRQVHIGSIFLTAVGKDDWKPRDIDDVVEIELDYEPDGAGNRAKVRVSLREANEIAETLQNMTGASERFK